MDREKEMKKAERFNREGCCYIHAEMEDGVTGLAVAGHYEALLHVMALTIERLGELTEIPSSVVLRDLINWCGIMGSQRKTVDGRLN